MWLQAGLSFGAWVLYGIWLARRAAARRESYACLCPVRRKVYGPLLMVVGAGLLLGGFALAVATQALGPLGFNPAAWLGLTVIGLVFVHCQVVATALILSLVDSPVTLGPGCAFVPAEETENTHEAPHPSQP